MSIREYPAGVPCWVDIAATDPRFYTELFGWELAQVSDGYQVARLRGGDVVGFGSPAPAGAGERTPAGWRTYVRVDLAADAAERVVAAGGTVLAAPSEVPGLARVAECADPSGATFRLWEAVEPAGRPGAQRVNEPGAWVFSDLYWTDPERASGFYGPVFGWQPKPVDFGFEIATMWCMPGYGDVQDIIDPGFRRRHEEGGSPDGFVDAFGWLHPLSGDTPTGTDPHWSVTFAVASADAVAEQAARLGGSAVVAPHDVGEFARVAVLCDPEGAAFTITEYHG